MTIQTRTNDHRNPDHHKICGDTKKTTQACEVVAPMPPDEVGRGKNTYEFQICLNDMM